LVGRGVASRSYSIIDRSRIGALSTPSALGRTLRRLVCNHVAWCVVATGGFALLVTNVDALSRRLGDPDDATRLVAVRELLHGSSWFDTTLPRIGAPEPLISHWSRLIDAPLAFTIGGLTPFVGPDHAELTTRVVWPLLLLFILQVLFVREAYRRGGNGAAALALVFSITSVTAMVQFLPGRIDHHNALILCTVAGLLLLVNAAHDARDGWTAGALLGLALAIGYEPIVLVLPALGLVGLVGVWTGQGRGAARALMAVTVTIWLAFAVTTRLGQWRQVHCDALSLNLLLLALCCTTGLWIALAVGRTRSSRLAIALGFVIVGVALFAALEPACLRGPFGQVNPAVKPIWLDAVLETNSILVWIRNDPSLGLAFAGFVLAGAAAQVLVWRRHSEATSAYASVIILLAVPLGFWQVKLTPYVSWLAAMGLALFVAELPRAGPLSHRITRFVAVVLLSQAGMMIALASANAALHSIRGGVPPPSDPAAAISSRCAESTSFAPLAGIPPGLIVADLELGPHIVAWSPHRVVAAPYHRLDNAIIANYAILGGSPQSSFQQLRALGAGYVALCQDVSAGRRQAIEKAAPLSLQARLLRNERIDFLQEITPGPSAPVRVWSVRR